MRYIKLYEQYGNDVVYHATSSNFDKFSKTHIGMGIDHGLYGHGFYFTDDLESATKQATHFIKNGLDGKVIKAKIKIKNPFYIDTTKMSFLGDYDSAKEFTNKLITDGYDGIIIDVKNIFTEQSLGETWYVAFEPEQITILN